MRKVLLLLLVFVGEAMSENPEDYPLVNGIQKMTKTWSINLGETDFRRRIEDGSLVIWRPGVTLWLAVWGYPEDTTREGFIEEVKAREGRSKDAKVLTPSSKKGLDFFGYHYKEEDQGPFALTAFVFGPKSHVHAGIYFDKERDLETVKSLWLGMSYDDT